MNTTLLNMLKTRINMLNNNVISCKQPTKLTLNVKGDKLNLIATGDDTEIITTMPIPETTQEFIIVTSLEWLHKVLKHSTSLTIDSNSIVLNGDIRINGTKVIGQQNEDQESTWAYTLKENKWLRLAEITSNIHQIIPINNITLDITQIGLITTIHIPTNTFTFHVLEDWKGVTENTVQITYKQLQTVGNLIRYAAGYIEQPDNKLLLLELDKEIKALYVIIRNKITAKLNVQASEQTLEDLDLNALQYVCKGRTKNILKQLNILDEKTKQAVNACFQKTRYLTVNQIKNNQYLVQGNIHEITAYAIVDALPF